MPDLDGFGVLEAIRDKAMPIIIFSTAYDQYAIKASGNYVEVHTGNTRILYRSSIAHIESELDPDNFMRIHRSLLINTNKIKRIEYLKNDTYKIVTANNDVLISGRTYKNNVSQIGAIT